MQRVSARAGRGSFLDRAPFRRGRAAGLAVLVTVCLAASTSCRRDRRAAQQQRESLAAQTAAPPELLAHGGLRAPGALIDRALQLVAGGLPLPLGRQPIVQLALGMAELPGAVADALELDRPLHFALFDARLGEHATLVALPIRSARAFGEALRATLEQRGREGELALWWPKGPAGQLRPLRVWSNERVALLAGSRQVFERARAFMLGRLVPTPLAHDLVLRINVPADAKRELERVLLHELTSLDGGSVAGNPLLRGVMPPAARRRANALSSAVTGFVTSARALELFADFDGGTLLVGGRAEARPGGALAQTIKRQRTSAPFGAALVPPSAWIFASVSRTPDPAAKDELLDALFSSAQQTLPAAERAAFAQAAERLRRRLLGDAALAVAGGSSAAQGMAFTLLARLDGRAGAAREVEVVAQALQRATLGPTPPAGARLEAPAGAHAVEAEPLGWAGLEGRILRLGPPAQRRARGARASGPPAPSAAGGIFGADPPQVGWLVGGSTLALVVAADARATLAPVAATLRGGAVAAAPPSLAQQPGFQRAAGRAPGRSGLVYVALDRLLEALAALGSTQPAELALAAQPGGPSAALTVDWGVDAQRQALDGAIQLPLARLLALKPLLAQLMSAATALHSPAGARAP